MKRAWGAVIALVCLVGLVWALLPPRWTAEGTTTWTRVDEGHGAEHCDAQDIPILFVFNDENKVAGMYAENGNGMTTGMTGRYDSLATLPADATFTGWRKGDEELWALARDPNAVYLVSPSGVERWPAIGGCV
jgi:hypothetical protein